MTKDLKTIEVNAEVFELLQEIKAVFTEVTGKADVTEEDVIATLWAWFLEWMQQQWSCCGSEGCEECD